jgi:hypothetical protein
MESAMVASVRFRTWRKVSRMALAVLLLHAGGAGAATLITPDEAKLPPAAFPPLSRGITRGPTVKVESPVAAVTSPFRLIVSFASFGGAQIALDTVKLTYLRNPPVDLTARVKPFVTPQGLGITMAEAPPGTHNLILEVTDSNARIVKLPITITVEPPR